MRIAAAFFLACLASFNAQAQANVQTLKAEFKLEAVSYTHLTLPTIYSV